MSLSPSNTARDHPRMQGAAVTFQKSMVFSKMYIVNGDYSEKLSRIITRQSNTKTS